MKAKAAGLVVVICLHVLIGNALEPPPGAFAGSLVILAIELLLVSSAALLFYLLVSSTFWFRAGLYSQLARSFRLFLSVLAANFLLTLVIRFWRVILLSSGTPASVLWGSAAYTSIWAVQKIVAQVYWSLCLVALNQLGDPIFHKAPTVSARVNPPAVAPVSPKK